MRPLRLLLSFGLLSYFVGIPAQTVGYEADIISNDANRALAISTLTIGSIFVAGSIALIIIDAMDIADLPNQFFKTATKSEILQALGQAEPTPGARAPRSGPSLIAAPFVPPRGGAGLALGLRF